MATRGATFDYPGRAGTRRLHLKRLPAQHNKSMDRFDGDWSVSILLNLAAAVWVIPLYQRVESVRVEARAPSRAVLVRPGVT
jgi:hypothetical protein